MSASMSSRRSVVQERFAVQETTAVGEKSGDLNFLISFSLFLLCFVLAAVAYKTGNLPLAIPGVAGVVGPVIYWCISPNGGFASRSKRR